MLSETFHDKASSMPLSYFSVLITNDFLTLLPLNLFVDLSVVICRFSLLFIRFLLVFPRRLETSKKMSEPA